MATTGTAGDHFSQFKESLRDRGQVARLSSDSTVSWLRWCRAQRMVKVTPWQVPDGILPPGYSGTLHDVKVGETDKKYGGPDDKIYNSSPEIRDKVARGNTVLELHHEATQQTQHDMVVFALKKFTGGMGDEDEEQPEDDLVWQRYFLAPLHQVSQVVCMTKENGEAAHVSIRRIEDQLYFIAGSKNVHLLFRDRADLELYSDGRFSVARMVGEAWLRQMESLQSSLLTELVEVVVEAGLTLIFEILCPGYQHVVDLSHLARPQLKFLSFTGQYSQASQGEPTSLVAFAPHLSLEFARYVGLDTAHYETITAAQAEERMALVRRGEGYEGEVLYFLDQHSNTIGLLKKKTSWYVVLRAIREKVSHVHSTYKRNPGGWNSETNNRFLAKMNKRLDEIQSWLSLTDFQLQTWKMLGKNFQNWLVAEMVKDKLYNIDKYSVRGNFPQLWKSFMTEGEISGLSNTEDCSKQVEVAEVSFDNVLEDPRASSPYVVVTEEVLAVRPQIGLFIVRNVDLMGRNLKKVLAAQHKTHGKVCQDRKLASIGFHDLEKIKSPRLVFTTCQQEREITPLGETESSAIRCLLQGGQTRAEATVGKYKHLLDHLDSFPVILNGETVISLPPLVNCEDTKISEDTEHILVEVTSDQTEDTLTRVVNALILQFYHMGIRLNTTQKSVQIERVKIVLPGTDSPTQILFPESLPNFNNK